MQLSTEDFQQLVILLKDLPQLATKPGRQAILDFAGLSRFVSTIDLSGETFVVTSQIVKQLSGYGLLEDGSYALGKFIKAIKQFTGAENQKWLDELISKYEIGQGSSDPVIATDSTKRWRILILSANPKNTEQLSLNEEVREIQEAIQRSRHSSNFSIEVAGAVRTKDIRRKIFDYKPNIIHFAGHGTGEDGLVVESKLRDYHLLDSEALANLFKLCSETVECVVLNACYSKVQADAISKHINYVIGMSNAIGDDAAIEFAIGFYDALGAGTSIEDAYEYGCNAVHMEGMQGHHYPILVLKGSSTHGPSPTTKKSRGGRTSVPARTLSPVLSEPAQPESNRKILWVGGIIAGLVGLGIAADYYDTFSSPPDPINGSEDIRPLPDFKRSLGEEFLISSNDPQRDIAANYFRDGYYQEAIQQLEAWLMNNPNDPEALIYLNNAEAERKRRDENVRVVKIGVSVPISGVSKGRAEEILRGIAHAQSKENCGKIEDISREINDGQSTISCNEGVQNNGFLLQVEIADDGNDNAIAKQVAYSFGSDSDIVAVVGHNDSSVTQAAIEIYDQFQLVVVSPTSSETDLAVKSDFFFRTVPSDEEIALALIQYAENNLSGKISICYNSGSVFSDSFTRDISDKQRSNDNNDNAFLLLKSSCDFEGILSPVSQSGVEATQNSLNQMILKTLEEDEANGLLVVPPTSDTSWTIEAINYVKEVREIQHVIASPSMYLGEILDGRNENILGTVVLTPWDSNISEKAKEFTREAEGLWKATVGTWRTPMAHDAALAIVNSLQERFGREEIKRNMPIIEFDGATGKVQFEDRGNRIGGKTYFAEIVENTPARHTFRVVSESDVAQ